MSTSIDMDPSKQREFETLQIEGKNLAAEGKLNASLKKFELAKLICPTAKVLRRIEKLKEYMKSLSVSDYDASTLETKGFKSTKNSTSLSNSKETNKVLAEIQNVEVEKASDFDSLSPESQLKFKELRQVAKELSYEGNFEEAIKCFQKALKLYDCPKVKRYIQDIVSAIRSNSEKTKYESPKSMEDENNSSGYKLNSKSADIGSSTTLTTKETFPNSKEVGDMSKEYSQSAQSSEATSSVSDSETKIDQVKELYFEARDIASEGKLVDALKLLKKAQDIQFTQKVQKQIKRLEELLSDQENLESTDGMIKIADDFAIFDEIYKKLYPYQREGVAWMWKLFKMHKGGLLGDDMGLGKTFQVIAFLSGMIDSDRAKHVLIIMPVSLITNWEREFKKWCPGISVHHFHGTSKKERERNLHRVQRRGHVLLTSYGMLVSNVDNLTLCEGCRFVWDYVILDEGHKIKNPTKTTKTVHEISARNRLILTGTPIQNNLRELWSLFDFVQHGTLLGSQKTFKMQYENPITRAREKDATAGEKHLGTEMAESLKSLIKPYFLRRTKDEIWKKTSNGVEDLENQLGQMKLSAKKNDLILWTYMTEPQIEIYKDFLHSDAVKSILVSKRSPLVELTTLKKICDHPRLLSRRACLQLGLDGELLEEDLMRELEDESNMTSTIENVPDETLLKESGKLNLVVKLLENLKENGHRTLVFSLSRKILDMLQRILANRQWRVMRLDGTISKKEERDRRIQKFQNDSRYPVFLITTQVGGVGITLTAADRVIIYDPSWNPATDSQAVDRVYRIGQEKNVVVYRLITCGTVEEKIYRRQIFKDSITRQTTANTGSTDPHRYFSKQELRELFSLDDPYTSNTQVQLSELHASQRNSDDVLENHIKYLESLNIFGISDHDLMFSKEIQDHTEDNDQAAISYDFIKKQVAMANELIQREASVVAEGMQATGSFHRPYTETVPLYKKYGKDTYKPPVITEVVDLTEDYPNVSSQNQQKPPKSPEFIFVEENKFPEVQIEEDVHIGSFAVSPKNKSHATPSDQKNVCASNDKMVTSFSSLVQKASPFSQKKTSLVSTIENKSITSPIKVEEDSTLPEKINDFAASIQNQSLFDTEKFRNMKEDDLPEIAIVQNLQMKLSDLTGVLDEDLNDLSILDEDTNRSNLKNRRKSCARKSVFISDSESSQQGSFPPSLNTSVENLVEDSYNVPSDSADSSNSASLSIVPDSIPCSPKIKTKKRKSEMVDNTPVKPGSVSFFKKVNDSVRRITPLKINRSLTKLDSSFAKALAASPMLSQQNSPVKDPANDNAPQNEDKNDSVIMNNYTPVRFLRKKTNRIASDSDESDHETSMRSDSTPTKICSKNTNSSDESVHEASMKSEASPVKIHRKKTYIVSSDSDHESSMKSEASPVKIHRKKTNHVASDSDHESSMKSEASLGKIHRKKTNHVSSDSDESDHERSMKSEASSVKIHRKKTNHVASNSDHESSMKSEASLGKIHRKKTNHVSSDSNECDHESSMKSEASPLKMHRKKTNYVTSDSDQETSLKSEASPVKIYRKKADSENTDHESKNEDAENDVTSEHSSALFSGEESIEIKLSEEEDVSLESSSYDESLSENDNSDSDYSQSD